MNWCAIKQIDQSIHEFGSRNYILILLIYYSFTIELHIQYDNIETVILLWIFFKYNSETFFLK